MRTSAYANRMVPLARRTFLAAMFALTGLAATPAAEAAASPSEQYISETVEKGLAILNDKTLNREQRRDKFQAFLMSLADTSAISQYTLGQYRRGAAPADIAAFDAAYKDYALAVYQTYFDKFSGQSLKVTGSYAPNPGESVVKTVMIDPHPKAGAKPMRVNFRVTQSGGKFSVIDISVEGVWLRQTQRDDFTGYLGQHGGDIKALIGVLKNKTVQERTHAK